MAYLNGKIAVVTGAGSGIGRELVHQLNAAGAVVYASDINTQELTITLDTRPRPEIPAHSSLVDVSQAEAVQAWAEEIGSQNTHVDIVINNAGVALMASAAQTDIEDFQWLMGINFWGVVYGSQAFLPLLKQAPQGHLVNISSIFGIVGIPLQSAYNAAKFAVRGYTEALRQEVNPKQLHVCCVHPGGIKTNIARDARVADPNSTPQSRAARFDAAARTTAASAAAQILTAIERRKARVLIGNDAKFLSLLSRLMPSSYPKVLRMVAPKPKPKS